MNVMHIMLPVYNYFFAALFFNAGGDFPVTCSPTKSDALMTNNEIK